MIVLITGASHTGKTALAQRLLENDQNLIVEGCYIPLFFSIKITGPVPDDMLS